MVENAVTLVGALTQDPVMRSGAKGDFATFGLAVRSRYRDGSGAWVDGQTSWFDVSAEGQLGRNAVASLAKGLRVVVHGTVGTRDVPKQDGSTARYVQVRASALGVDLQFGTARFVQGGRGPTATAPSEGSAPSSGSALEGSAQREREEAGTGADWGGRAAGAPAEVPVPAAWTGSSSITLPAGDDVPF